MRIAILSCFYPYRGGISQFNTYLLKELSKEHTVKAFNFKRQYPEFLFPGKTQYVTEDDTALAVESEVVLDTANPLSYIRTARKIADWNPDVLLTRYWMSYFAPSLGTVARHVAKILEKRAKRGESTSKFKAVSIVDNIIPHEKHCFDVPLAKFFIRRNNGFVALSTTVEREIRSITQGLEGKCITIPHPLYSNFGERVDILKARRAILNSPLYNSLSDSDLLSRKVLLFFGLIREYKGLDILLEAMPLLDETYTLVVAGEPYGSFKKYEQILSSPRLKRYRDNIFINTNYIPDSDVKLYFSAADLCVLPYRTATQSGISSISWNFDVPLVTTPVGGLPESVGEQGTGLLARDTSVEEIANAIKKYFDDEDKERYICNIRELKERLGWKSFCAHLTEFINQL